MRVLILIGIIGLIIIAFSVFSPRSIYAQATPYTTYTPPTSISDTCSSDATSALNSWFASLPSGATVDLPTNGCYLVSNSSSSLLLIQNLSGVTINGNGTTFEQTSYAGSNVVTPVMELGSNTNLNINNIIIDGPSSAGGAGEEGDYGIKMWLNKNVTFDSMTIENVEGDGIAIYPSPSSQTSGVNQNVTIDNSTFTGIGYHTLTPESVNGLLVENSTFDSADFDAEVDFNCQASKPPYPDAGNPCGSIASPSVGAENITFIHNTFPSGAFMELSISCLPTGNWLITDNNFGNGALDLGMPLGYSATAYACGAYQNLTITNNTGNASSGSGRPLWGSGSEFWDIYGWNNVNISNNTLAFPTVQVGDKVMNLCADSHTNIENNSLTNLNTFYTTNCGTGLSNGSLNICGNTYGAAGKTQTEGSCNTPSVSLSTPLLTSSFSGNLVISANASAVSPATIHDVQFQADDSNIAGCDPTQPSYQNTYLCYLSASSIPNGINSVTAIATDSNGQTSAATYPVHLTTDTGILPSTSIGLAAGSLEHQTISIPTTNQDNSGTGLTGVNLYLNHTQYVGSLTSSPYNFSLNTLNYPDGMYTLTAQATDGNNGIGSSGDVSFYINNGDLNGDGTINLSDLAILASNYGKSGTFSYSQGNITGSTSGNDEVNLSDLSILAANWGWTK